MLRQIARDQKVLAAAGLLSFAAFAVLACISTFDSFEIMGVNRWMKPMKFSISIGIYLWTIAAYLYFLDGHSREKKVIGYTISLVMTAELVPIITQAARGTTSHFNVLTAVDNAVFSLMGLLIMINTFLVFYLLYLYFRAEVRLPRAVVWGMRLGLIFLIFTSFVGGYMAAILQQHSVGIADGGEGLPFVNWSTKGGDLRAAHFIGMHALQAIPLFAVIVQKINAARASMLTFSFAIAYFAVFTAMLAQAMAGRPVWAMGAYKLKYLSSLIYL